MKISCSYCLKTLSFIKGDLFKTVADADWRIFGIDIRENSHYYICDSCRKAKKLNLPLYTPPALTKKVAPPQNKLTKPEEPICLKI